MLTFALIRVVHILAGVFWVGTIIFIAAFLAPGARRIPGGGPFLGAFFARTPLARVIAVAGALNILSGLFLYWTDSQGFRLAWVLSRTGLTFTLGALAAIGGAVAAARQGRIASRIPTVDEAERPALIARVERAEIVTTILLVLAVTAMAAARYA
jgi:hypothetical protein